MHIYSPPPLLKSKTEVRNVRKEAMDAIKKISSLISSDDTRKFSKEVRYDTIRYDTINDKNDLPFFVCGIFDGDLLHLRLKL